MFSDDIFEKAMEANHWFIVVPCSRRSSVFLLPEVCYVGIQLNPNIIYVLRTKV